MKQFGLLLLPFIFGLWSCTGNKGDEIGEATKENRIFDNANLLTPTEVDSIFYLIEDLDKNIGSQIAILTIDTLNGVDIKDYSIKEAEKLGLGRDKQKDGLLIMVSLKDKSVRIEVGNGLEKIITNGIAARIISDVIVPEFKEGRFGRGIYNAVDTIKVLIEGNKGLVGEMPEGKN